MALGSHLATCGLAASFGLLSLSAHARNVNRDLLEAMIAVHAKINGVPASLVHRVIVRESRYNPGLIGKGNAMGLMQIKPATARGLGYQGSASGLLDAETNLTYAVKYLAGAYRLANGNETKAVSYYARGYYFDAKNKGLRMEALAQPPDEE